MQSGDVAVGSCPWRQQQEGRTPALGSLRAMGAAAGEVCLSPAPGAETGGGGAAGQHPAVLRPCLGDGKGRGTWGSAGELPATWGQADGDPGWRWPVGPPAWRQLWVLGTPPPLPLLMCLPSQGERSKDTALASHGSARQLLIVHPPGCIFSSIDEPLSPRTQPEAELNSRRIGSPPHQSAHGHSVGEERAGMWAGPWGVLGSPCGLLKPQIYLCRG